MFGKDYALLQPEVSDEVEVFDKGIEAETNWNAEEEIIIQILTSPTFLTILHWHIHTSIIRPADPTLLPSKSQHLELMDAFDRIKHVNLGEAEQLEMEKLLRGWF